jgi:site-specific recombinase XerD
MQQNLLNLYQLHLQDPENNQGKTLSKVSVKNYVSDIRKFLEYVETNHAGATTADLNHDLVESYKNFLLSKSTPIKTINRYISSLRRFGAFLEKNFGIQNPVFGIQSIQPKITLTDLKNIYSSYLKDQNKSESTIKNYISDLDQFFIFIFTSYKLDTLPSTADQITGICERYEAQLRVSGKSSETVARHIVSLKQFFAFAHTHGYSQTNPFFQKDTQNISVQAQIIPSPRIPTPATQAPSPAILRPIEPTPRTSRLPLYFLAFSLVALASAFGYSFIKELSSPLTNSQRQLISFIKDHELTLSPSGTLKLDQETLKVIAPLLPNVKNSKGEVAGVSTLGGSEITFGGALDENFNLSLKGDVTADQFISTTTTEAPLIVSSKQLVNNLNADMVDGFHADTNAGKGEIPAIDQNGQITFVDPTKIYSEESLSVEAASLNLASTFGSDGSVNINPDGSGKVNILANNQSGQTLLINNAQLTSGSLIQGQVGNNSNNFSFLKFLKGNQLTPVFDVSGNGDIKFAGKFSDKYASNIALSDAANNTLPAGTSSILGAIKQAMNSGSGDSLFVDGGSYIYPKDRESLRIYDSTGNDYLEIAHNGTDGEVKVQGTTRINFDPSILISGSLNVDGDMILGNSTSDTINIKGQISNSLGAVTIDDDINFANFVNCSALETDSNGNITCGNDDTGANSIFDVVGDLIVTHFPSYEFSIGGTSTASATFHVGLAGDIQAGGAASNVSYSRFGTNTTNHSLSDAYDLLVSGEFETDGLAYFDGATTFGSTVTLPNSNTLTGSAGFLQLSQGLSVGGANTYFFNNTGDINANSIAIGGTSIVTSGRVIQNITQANIDNLRLDGNTLDTTSGDLTLDSATGTTNINDNANINGNIVVTGTTTLNSIAYTWPATQNSNYILSTNGSGALSWSDPAVLASASIYWTQANGSLFPKNSTVDAFIGGQSTDSADFAFIGVNSGTPTATIAGTLSLAGNGLISTSNFTALTLGNANTGDINLTPGTGKRVNIQGTTTFIDNSGNLTLNGNLTVNGSGTHTIAGTLDPNNVAAFTLTGGITGNGQNILGLGQLTVDNLRLDGNTLDTTSGDLTLDSTTGTTNINDNTVINGNATVTGTTTFNSITYTWPGSQTNNYVLSTNGTGGLSWSDPAALAGATIYWTQANGALFPKNSTVDAFIGGNSTASADFAFIGVNSGTPTATIAGTLSLAGNGAITTTNFTSLVLGNASTGDIYLSPGAGKTVYLNGSSNYVDSNGNLVVTGNISGDDITAAGNLDVNGTSNDIAGTLNLSGNNLTSTGDLTINPAGGDLNLTDGVTFNVGGNITDVAYNVIGDNVTTASTNVNSDDDLYIEGNLEVDGNIYGTLIGTINPNFTVGSVIFQGPGGLAEDNASFYFDDTNNLFGFGTNTPVAKLQLTGAATGKALAIFNETGDQDIFTASASGNTMLRVTNGGNLILTGNLTVNGSGTHTIAGTLDPTNVAAFTLTGGITGNSQNILGLGQLTVDNLRLDGNTLDSTSGDLTLDSASGTTNINDNLTVAGTTTLGGITYTWPGSQSPSYILATNGSGTLSWADPAAIAGASTYWTQANGSLFPKNSTVDAFIGGQSTASADFAFIGVNSGTPTASIAGTLSLAGDGTISTTNMNTLTIGNSSTGNVLISPDTGKDIQFFNANNYINNAGNLFITGDFSVGGGNIAGANGAAIDLGDTFPGDLALGSNTDIITNDGTFIGLTASSGRITFSDLSTDEIGIQNSNLNLNNNLVLNIGNAGTDFDAAGGLTLAGDLAINGGDLTSASDLAINAAGGDIVTANRVTIGTTTPGVGQLNVDGAQIGKALAIFNETGDQNIITASASGTTRFVITNAGNVGIGTKTPGSKLDIVNDANDDALTITANGTQTNPIFRIFESDGTTESVRFYPGVADGANSTAYIFDTVNALSTTGSRLLSLRNNGTEQAAFTSAGDLVLNAQADLRLYDSDSSNYTGFQAPATLGSDIVYTLPTADGTNNYVLKTNGSGTLAWVDANTLVSAASYWGQDNGVLYPVNDTVDVLIGGQASSSAKFAFLNVNSGTPTASISAGTAGATYITANGTIQTTANQSLTLGGSTTGNINFFNTNNNINSSGNLTLAGTINLPNSNTVTGVSNYVQFSNGISVGGATTYNFTSAGVVNASQVNVDNLRLDGNTLSSTNGNINISAIDNSFTLISNNSGGAATLQVNQLGSGPIFTASSSGTTKFTIANDGLLTLANNATIDNTVNGTLAFTEPTISLNGSTSIDINSPLIDLSTQATNIDLINSNASALTIETSLAVFDTNNSRVGIGTTGPDAKLDVLSTTEQLRLTYADGSAYTSFTVSSGGDLNIDTTGNDITTTDRLTIGSSTAGVGKLTVTGQETGKALAIFNEVGDQAIIAASASGVPILTVNHLGNMELNNQSASDIKFDLQNNGDFTILDNGLAFATFSDLGVFTLDSLVFDGTTIGLTTDTNLISLQNNIVTVEGDVRLEDGYTLEVGGKINISYNAFADSSDNPDEAAIAQDNDLYVGGDLEVDGNIYGTVVGTINPAFTVGSVIFQGVGGLAQDNASFYFDDTNNRLGLGTNTPITKLHLTGTTDGKALAILDETGTDQNILTASASGTTVLNLDRSGNLIIEGTLSDLTDAALGINDNLSILGTTLSIGNGSNATINTTGTSNLTLNPTGELYFDDTRTSAIPLSISDTDLSGFPVGDQAIVDAINYLKSTLSGGGGGSGDALWRLTFPLIHPDNLAYDLGIGGTSSSSALFHVEGATGNASTSGTLTFRDVESNIGTINMQTLQLGGSTTGNIIVTANGDTDDYLTLSTTGNVPSIIGTGSYVRIGDLTTSSILSIPTEDDLFVSNRLEVNNGAFFGATDYLQIEGDGDLLFVDANNGATITGPDGGALTIVGASSQAINITSNDSSTYTVNGGSLTLDVAGDIVLDADGSDVLFRDGVSNFLTLTHGGSNNVYFNSGADGANFTFRDDTANNNLFTIKDQGAYSYVNLLGKTTNGDPATCTAGDLYFNSADQLLKICKTTDTWDVLGSGITGGVGTDGFWRVVAGALSPVNNTLDLLIGSDSTASSSFAFTGLSSGNLMATFSGNLTLNAATPTISTTNSRDLVLDPSGSKVVIQDDLKITGGDILGSNNETRITLSDSIDTTLISGILAVNVVTPVENVDIDGDIKLINSTTQRGDIYTHANATDRLWTLSGDFNFPGASMSGGMENPANNDELKLRTIEDLTNQTWTSTADFNAATAAFSSGMLNPATDDQLRLDNTFTSPAGLAGWIHRKSITISNGSGGTLTSYQTRIEVNTATLVSQGKMQSDCGDMRFTESDGTTSVPFWIETGCNTTTTVVWLKPASLASGSNTVYMYYDNSYASDGQSGSDVFAFFDDFTSSGIDTTKWTLTNSTGFTVSGGNLNGTNTTGRLTSIYTYSDGYTQESKYNMTTGATGGVMTAGTYISASNAFGLLDVAAASADFSRNNSTWTSIGNRTPLTTDLVASIAATSNTNVKMSVWNFSTHAYVYNPTDNTNTVSAEPIVIGERYDNTSTGQAYNVKWDWIRVRKYSATEPTSTVNSEEEGAYDSGDQTWTSDNIDAGDSNTFKPTKLTFTWTNDSTASATTLPKVRVEGSNDSAFSSFTTYPNGLGTYWQDGGTYDISSGEETDVSSQITSSFRYWRVVTTINTGTYRLDTPTVNSITLSGQGQYSAGSQFWVSETIDAGSGSTYKPNRFTAAWVNDGSDNIKPQFQVWASNSTTFGAEAVVYPAGLNSYYQDGGTYDLDSGTVKDISTEVTTAYRYWRVKAIITTDTNTGDTPKVLNVRLQEERPLNLQPYGQKIGIGTTAPDALLDVVQNVKTDIFKVSSNSGGISYFTIKSNGDTDFGGVVKNDINVNLYGDMIQQSDTTLQTGFSGIVDTYLYDSTTDNDGGAWRKSPTTKTLSWYTESKDDGTWDSCNISSDDRCGESNFPAKALLIVNSNNLYIIDAKTNKMWMKFSQGSSFAMGPSTGNTPTSVTALDGVIYVSTAGDSGSTGIYSFDFKTDTMAYFDSTQRAESSNGIAQRNDSNSYDVNTNTAFALSNEQVNDLDVTTHEKKRYLAAATNSGVNLIDLDYVTNYEYLYAAGQDGGTITSDGDDATNVPSRAFDYNDTTYVRSNAADNTLILTYQFATPQNIRRYVVVADDADTNEAPAAWTFQASSDGSTWTTLDTKTAQTYIDIGTSMDLKSVDLSNTQSYTYYRINVTDAVNSVADSIRIAELYLMTRQPVRAIKNFHNNMYGTRPYVHASNTDAAAQKFDHLNDMRRDAQWAARTGMAKASALEQVFPSPVVAKQYSITAAATAAQFPSAWTFSGSNDGITYDTLDTQSSITLVQYIRTTYQISNTNSYKFYRLDITNTASSATDLEVAEFDVNGPAITASGSNNNTTNDETNVWFNDQPTTGYYYISATGTANSAWIRYDYNTNRFVANSYSMRGYVTLARAWKSWTFQACDTDGSQDCSAAGAGWVTLDTQTNVAIPFSSATDRDIYTFANSTAYRYYRVKISANNGDANFCDLREFQVSSNRVITSNEDANTINTAAEQSITNGTSTDYWFSLSTNIAAQWVQAEFEPSYAPIVTSMTLSGTSTTARSPKDWRLLASNDQITWTTLLTRKNADMQSTTENQFYNFSNNTAYRFYRLLIDRNNTDASYVTLGEWQLGYTKYNNVRFAGQDLVATNVTNGELDVFAWVTTITSSAVLSTASTSITCTSCVTLSTLPRNDDTTYNDPSLTGAVTATKYALETDQSHIFYGNVNGLDQFAPNPTLGTALSGHNIRKPAYYGTARNITNPLNLDHYWPLEEADSAYTYTDYGLGGADSYDRLRSSTYSFPTATASGKFGRAARFYRNNADTIYVDDAYIADPYAKGNGYYSYGAWFYSTDLATGANNRMIMGTVYTYSCDTNGDTSSGTCYSGWYLNIVNDRLYQAGCSQTEGAGCPYGGYITDFKVNPYQWYHVAVRRNATDYSLFLDGVKRYTSTSSTVYTVTDGSTFEIGTGGPAYNSSTYSFDGVIDEPFLAYKGLSDEEVRTWYRYSSGDTEVTSSASDIFTATTLGMSNSNWPLNQYKGTVVEVATGSGVGQTRLVVKNSSEVLTTTPSWTTLPDATSRFEITPNRLPGNTNAVKTVRQDQNNLFIGLNDNSDAGGVVRIDRKSGKVIDYYHGDAGKSDDHGNSWGGSSGYDNIVSIESTQDNLFIAAANNLWHEKVGDSLLEAVDKLQQGYASSIFNSQTQETGGNDISNTSPMVMRKGWGYIFGTDSSKQVKYGITYQETPVVMVTQAGISDTYAPFTLDQCQVISAAAQVIASSQPTTGWFYVTEAGVTTNYYCFTWLAIGRASQDLPQGSFDAGADLAEWYGTDDDTLAAGEVVAVAKSGDIKVVRSEGASNPSAIGIIATQPSIVLGTTSGLTPGYSTDPQLTKSSKTAVQVALAGRVPVKVSLENGPIKAGDYLTTSSIPGYAAKAITAGPTIGKAMEDFDGSSTITGYGYEDTQVDPIVMEKLKALTQNADFLATDSATPSATVQAVTESEAFDGVDKESQTFKDLKDGKGVVMTFVNNSWYDPTASSQQAYVKPTTKDAGTYAIDGTGRLIALGSYTNLPSPTRIESIEDSTNSATPSSQIIINKLADLGNLATGTLKAATVDVYDKLTAGSVETNRIATNFISPLASDSALTIEGKLNVIAASVSGELTADNAKIGDLTVDNLTVNNINGVAQSLDQISEATQAARSFVDKLLARAKFELEPATSSSAPELNADLNNLTNLDLADLRLDNLTINDSLTIKGGVLASDLMIENSLITSNIGTDPTAEEQTLMVQASGKGKINLLAGLMILDESGNIAINGDVAVNGNLIAKSLQSETSSASAMTLAARPMSFGSLLAVLDENGSVVASIDASGSAQFKDLKTRDIITSNIVIAVPASGSASTVQSAVNSNATVGSAQIAAGATEIEIQNTNAKEGTLIYITPTSDTQNQVLFVKSKTDGKFTIAISSSQQDPISFNYWLVQTKSTPIANEDTNDNN